MSAKRRTAKKAASRAVLPPLRGTTLMHISYHPEQNLLRANVVQDVVVAGEKQRLGRDVDIAIDDLSADIRGALKDAFNWIAEDVDASAYKRTSE